MARVSKFHSVIIKVVDNGENYLNMKLQLKQMQRSPENDQKPHVLTNCL